MFAREHIARRDIDAPEFRVARLRSIHPCTGVVARDEEWPLSPEEFAAEFVGVIAWKFAAVHIVVADIRLRASPKLQGPVLCAKISPGRPEVHVVGSAVSP